MTLSLDHIKKLKTKATPGPWDFIRTRFHDCEEAQQRWAIGCPAQQISIAHIIGDVKDDAAFIAALPDIADIAISAMEEVERLKHLHGLDHSLADQRETALEKLKGKKCNCSPVAVIHDRGCNSNVTEC